MDQEAGAAPHTAHGRGADPAAAPLTAAAGDEKRWALLDPCPRLEKSPAVGGGVLEGTLLNPGAASWPTKITPASRMFRGASQHLQSPTTGPNPSEVGAAASLPHVHFPLRPNGGGVPLRTNEQAVSTLGAEPSANLSLLGRPPGSKRPNRRLGRGGAGSAVWANGRARWRREGRVRGGAAA